MGKRLKSGLVLLCVCFVYLSFLIYRNDSVCDFRNGIVDKCYNYNRSNILNKKIKDAMLLCHDLPSYNDMLYGFESLSVESYLDTKVIVELNRSYVDNLEDLK